MKRLSRLLRNFYSVGSQRDAGCGFTIREGIVKLADGIWRGNEKFVLLPCQSHIGDNLNQIIMSDNKHALIRYETIDRCLSNTREVYHLQELLDACNDEILRCYGEGGIEKRQLYKDLEYMKEHCFDGKHYGEAYLLRMPPPVSS